MKKLSAISFFLIILTARMNVWADGIPPTLLITQSPAANSCVSGLIHIEGTAADNDDVQKVAYRVTNDAFKLLSNVGGSEYRFRLSDFPTTLLPQGINTFEFRAIDNSQLSSSITLDLEIDNTPPEITVTGIASNTQVSGLVSISVQTQDLGCAADGNIEIFRNGESVFTVNGAIAKFDWETEEGFDGTFNFLVVAKDAGGNEAQTKINGVVVNNSAQLNQAPTANAGSDQLSVGEGNRVTLNGSASSDPEMATLNYFWRQVSGRSVTLSDPKIANPEFDVPYMNEPETLTFELVVKDDLGQPSKDEVDITIDYLDRPNQNPIGNPIVNVSGHANSLVLLDASDIIDLENDTLTYIWDNDWISDLTIDDDHPYRAALLVPSDTGSEDPEIQLMVIDPFGGSMSRTFSLTVNSGPAPNSAPILNAIGSQTIERGETLNLTATALELDSGDNLTFSLDSIPVPPFGVDLDSITGELTWATQALSPASADITVRVTDNGSLSDSETIRLNVIDTTPPTVQLVEPTDGANLSGEVLLTGSASDISDSHLEVQFEVMNEADEVVAMTRQTAAPYGFSWGTSSETFPDGAYAIKMKAIDSEGNVAETPEITVNISNQSQNDPPQVVIQSPELLAHVQEETLIEGKVTGDNVERVELIIEVNETEVVKDTFLNPSPNYSLTLDTNDPDVPAGDIFVKVRATAGSLTDEQSLPLHVDNQDPTEVEFLSPLPAVGEDEAVVSGVQAFRIQAQDNSEINSVIFKIGDSDIATVFGDPDQTQGQFEFPFDSTPYDNGSGNLMFATVIDSAGNKNTIFMTFTIDKSLRSGIEVTAHPANNSTNVSAAESEIYFTFEGGEIPQSDDDQIIPRERWIQITTVKDGVTKSLNGQAQWNSGRLVWNGESVPPNAEARVTMELRDSDGFLLTEQTVWKRLIDAGAGGRVVLDVSANGVEAELTLDIGAGSLDDNAFVVLRKLDPSNLPALINEANNQLNNLQDEFRILAGPFEAFAQKANGEILRQLSRSASLTYRELQPSGALEELGRVLQIHQLDGDLWNPLGNNSQAHASLANQNLQPRIVNVDIGELSTFQVSSIAIPEDGISRLFNMPNPFSPKSGGTRVHYYLGSDSDVTWLIYDLFGNLVKRQEFASGTNGGRQTQNLVTWDGKNGKGHDVANGGYILVIEAEDNQGNTDRERHKLGVVK